MLNEMFNVIAGESERRAPVRRMPFTRAIRVGSGERRAVVQLRRVRSEHSGRSHPLSWNEATMRTALSRIITF
jgi:hypothetical protein